MSDEWISCEVKDSKIIDKEVIADVTMRDEVKSICNLIVGKENDVVSPEEIESLLNDDSKSILDNLKDIKIEEYYQYYDFQDFLNEYATKRACISFLIFCFIIYNYF